MQKDILEFATFVKRYCRLIEKEDEYGRDEFLRKVHFLFGSLYLAALKLSGKEGVTGKRVTGQSVESYEEVVEGLKRKLGDIDRYRMVFNPYDVGYVRSDTSTLSDDLADIYLDLKKGLTKYEQDTEETVRIAAGHWRNSFLTHWGYHVVIALHALHWVVYG